MFASYTNQFVKTLNLDVDSTKDTTAKTTLKSSASNNNNNNKTRIKVVSEQAKRVLQDQGFIRTINRFENNFNLTLKQLIDSLHNLSSTEANYQMSNLALRLDFNDFYRNYFEKLRDEQITSNNNNNSIQNNNNNNNSTSSSRFGGRNQNNNSSFS